MATERYSFQQIKQIQDSDGTQKNIISILPTINPSDLYSSSDIFLKIQAGQRIDNLAFKYLGDGKYWWAICLINGLANPFDVSLISGTLLRIPTSINKIIQFLESNAT
jgi:hypothetical protein